MKKLLIVGDTGRHMHRWLRHVSSVLPEDMAFDMFCSSKGNTDFIGIDKLFFGKEMPFSNFLSKIPKVRGLVRIIENKLGLYRLLRSQNYVAMIVHQPSIWQYDVIKLAKQKQIKVILTPWGSDVLRISHRHDKKMSKMFMLADAFTSSLPNFASQYIERYDVDKSKMVYAGFGSEVLDFVEEYKTKYTKDELASFLSIPRSNYYIACGYTAQRAQNHLQMVEALGVNKGILPQDSLLVFQFTYGNNHDLNYIAEIKTACDKYELRYHFLTDYLSNEDMAKYRLLADLFIHIQPTDAANASLQEFLLAGCECINGGWLKYPQLEQNGYPYYICPSLDDLPSVVKDVLMKKAKRTLLSEEAKTTILNGSWNNQKKYWSDFLKTLL